MITVARWRIVVVALATIFGILFTLPNLLPASMRESLPGFLPSKTLNLGLHCSMLPLTFPASLTSPFGAA